MKPALLLRRSFLRSAGVATAALPFASSLTAAGTAVKSGPAASTPRAKRIAERFPICGLEKHFFEKYTPEQTPQTYAEIGIDIELTVRPDGHVKPENAAAELPALAAAFARHNRRILIVASSFVRPDEPHIESTLRAAKALGISLYRHRGFRYRPGTPLKAQIADFRRMAREFAAMNREIGMQALFQNHAGADFAGAAIWDLDLILESLLPRGAAYLHRHGSPGHGRDHVLPALVAPSVTVPVLEGRMQLGTWQSIVLVDPNADNPHRQVRLSFLAG